MSTMHAMPFSQNSMPSSCIQYTHGDAQCSGVMCNLFSSGTDNNSSYVESQDEDEDEDVIVDLNSGSMDPVSLKSWTLMTEMTEQFTKL